jgi:hypothetical protein
LQIVLSFRRFLYFFIRSVFYSFYVRSVFPFFLPL